MPEIKTEFLFTIALEVQVFNLGDTPYGSRRIARFGTGSFEMPKLMGTVLPGGAKASSRRRDDVLEIDVRLVLETDDKQQIYMTWKGFRHDPKEVIDRLNRGETVDPGTYYFRTTPYFETSSEKVCLDEPYLLDRHWLARGVEPVSAWPRCLEWPIRVFPLIPRRYRRQDIPMLDYLSVLDPKQIIERSWPGEEISLRQYKYKVAFSHETARGEI
jgi:hypothetical protein